MARTDCSSPWKRRRRSSSASVHEVGAATWLTALGVLDRAWQAVSDVAGTGAAPEQWVLHGAGAWA